VNLEFTFFKLLPRKAELGTEPPELELFKHNGVLLTAPTVVTVEAMDGLLWTLEAVITEDSTSCLRESDECVL